MPSLKEFFKVRYSVLPGFGLTLGITLFYLSAIVLIPLSGLIIKSGQGTWQQFWQCATGPRVLASYRLTFGASLIAAGINAVLGLLVAWVLTRYTFPLKKIVDATVDLPFALPTAVAGIALTDLYAPQGWIGKLIERAGIHVAFTQLGILVALTFIGLPFAVRTVQPVLEEMDTGEEEASVSLGAGRWRTFVSVIFPEIWPALLTGFTLAFARALGEYGSVIFISGNLPFKTEIASFLIMSKLEQYDYLGAASISVVMLVSSFAFLLLANLFQHWSRNRRQTAQGEIVHV